jgi:hypothetical protein
MTAMKRLSATMLLAGLTLAAAAVAKPAKLTLTQNGQPASTIVVAKTPTKAAALAALELQTHVKAISGATLPIMTDDQAPTGTRLLVGESAATRALGYSSATFATQEYAIVFTNDAIGAVVLLLGRDKPESFDAGALGVFGDPLTWVPGRYGNAASFDGSVAFATISALWSSGCNLRAARPMARPSCSSMTTADMRTSSRGGTTVFDIMWSPPRRR